jgi:signal transduction histidine kinase
LGAVTIVAVVSMALGWLIAGRFVRPLRSIIATTRDISASNLHRRLGLRGRGDELTELGETIDDLFTRLESSFDSQRNFIANASHELRTPLSAGRALLQVAIADPEPTVDSLRETCEELLELGDRQERLIAALLTLASGESGIEEWEPFDLAEIAGNVLLARSEAAERQGVEISAALSAAPAKGDPRLAESLVVNLVDNAIRYNVAGGRVAVSTIRAAGQATFRISNTGAVIPPGEVDRLFEPFQRLGGERTRTADGYGLGLAVVRAVADAHGATLTSRAQPEGGLDIEVSFPGQPPD